jgi:hypothetical protein
MVQTPARAALCEIGKTRIMADNFARQAGRSVAVNIRAFFYFIGARHQAVPSFTGAGVTI